MYDGYGRALKYLLLFALTSRKRELLALKEYYVRGGVGDIASIAKRYGFKSKHVLSGYKQRLEERLGGVNRTLIFFNKLISSGAFDYIMNLNPIVIYFPKTYYPYYCLICNRGLHNKLSVISHINTRHRDLINKYVEAVLQILNA